MSPDARAGQRAVANLANVIDSDTEVRKGTKEVVQPLPNPGLPVIVAGDGSEQRLDLATRVVKRDKFVEVTTIQGIKSPASQLHVPQRHASDVLHRRGRVAGLALGDVGDRHGGDC